MANIPLSVPFQFRRTSNTPLDYTSVVSTTTELNSLTSDATSYLGMQVFNVENQTLYVLITSGENSLPHFYALGGNNSSAGQEASTQLQSVSSSLAGQITSTQTTAYNNLTSLSSNVYGAVGEALAQQISSLSAFDTITELAAAVDSLSSYKTSSNFLSASSPEIATGDLTLANGYGIKMYGGSQSVIDYNRNVFANALYVGANDSVYPKIDSQGVYAAADYYIKTSDGAAKVGALTATSLEIGSFKVDSTGKITQVQGIDSQGAIDAQSHDISTTGTVKAGTLSATSSVYGNNLSLTQGITSSGNSFKVDASGNITAASLEISGGNHKIESDGDATLRDLTVDSINNNGALSAASGKFVVDSSGHVTVGVIGGQEANLTVTGNLSVLGTTTYLDTNVTTMSAVVAELNSNSATTLAVKQTGSYAIATFENTSGVKLTVSNSGSLSATEPATFDSTVNVGAKLTVTEDISSTKTVYASAAQFSTTLEVGTGSSVLYVSPDGVGIDTESLDGYSLRIGTAGTNNGTMYVGGSANFVAQANIINADSTISSGGAITNGSRIVNVNTLWQFISALDGGSF